MILLTILSISYWMWFMNWSLLWTSWFNAFAYVIWQIVGFVLFLSFLEKDKLKNYFKDKKEQREYEKEQQEFDKEYDKEQKRKLKKEKRLNKEVYKDFKKFKEEKEKDLLTN